MDYLLKTEPTEYSFADLTRDRRTRWDGVSNPVALRNLRSMREGDRALGAQHFLQLDDQNKKNALREVTRRGDNEEELHNLDRENEAKDRYIRELKEQIEQAKQEAADLERELGSLN